MSENETSDVALIYFGFKFIGGHKKSGAQVLRRFLIFFSSKNLKSTRPISFKHQGNDLGVAHFHVMTSLIHPTHQEIILSGAMVVQICKYRLRANFPFQMQTFFFVVVRHSMVLLLLFYKYYSSTVSPLLQLFSPL